MWNQLTSDERAELVRQGVEKGLSSTQIAEWIGGCSRNAVIGIAHRRKIKLTRSLDVEAIRDRRAASLAKKERKPDDRLPPPPRVETKREAKAPAPDRLKVERMPVLRPPDRPVSYSVPVLRNIPLTELTAVMCKWPTGDPRLDAGFGFCGNDRMPGDSPYCGYHSRLAYQPPENRKRLR